jgi:signal transduction histidine kinase
MRAQPVAHRRMPRAPGLRECSEGRLRRYELCRRTSDVKDASAAFGESTELAEALVAQLQPKTEVAGRIAGATNVAALVDRTVLVLQRILRSRVRISTRLDQDCWIPLAEHELRRILLNLATNARDATPKGGEFSIACWRDGNTGEVALLIEDNGTGMDEATQARVFDAYPLLNRSPSRLRRSGAIVEVQSCWRKTTTG